MPLTPFVAFTLNGLRAGITDSDYYEYNGHLFFEYLNIIKKVKRTQDRLLNDHLRVMEQQSIINYITREAAKLGDNLLKDFFITMNRQGKPLEESQRSKNLYSLCNDNRMLHLLMTKVVLPRKQQQANMRISEDFELDKERSRFRQMLHISTPNKSAFLRTILGETGCSRLKMLYECIARLDDDERKILVDTFFVPFVQKSLLQKRITKNLPRKLFGFTFANKVPPKRQALQQFKEDFINLCFDENSGLLYTRDNIVLKNFVRLFFLFFSGVEHDLTDYDRDDLIKNRFRQLRQLAQRQRKRYQQRPPPYNPHSTPPQAVPVALVGDHDDLPRAQVVKVQRASI